MICSVDRTHTHTENTVNQWGAVGARRVRAPPPRSTLGCKFSIVSPRPRYVRANVVAAAGNLDVNLSACFAMEFRVRDGVQSSRLRADLRQSSEFAMEFRVRDA